MNQLNQPREPRDSHNPQDIRRQKARRAAMRKKQQHRQRLQLLTVACAALLVLVILLAVLLSQCGKKDSVADTLPSTDNSSYNDVIATAPSFAGWDLTAAQYFVYDSFVDSFIAISENNDARIFPASITKLVTAEVVLKYLSPDTTVTAGEALNLVAAGSSVAGLEKGDTLTVKELIAGMLLPSGNDAACVLAAEAGKKILNQPSADATTAINAFVSQMNAFAMESGMSSTHFANPDGIHNDNHYSTYRDLVTMAKIAVANPTVMEYCAMSSLTVTTKEGRTLQWHNTNLLVDSSSEYYHEAALGLKTGQTPSAGSCLLSVFDINGVTVIVGVFGCPDVESRFADTHQLMQMYAD